MALVVDNRTHDKIERELREIDWSALTSRSYTPSPIAWEDQILYFLMVDRFSDDRERGYRTNNGSPSTGGTTPPFTLQDAGSANRAQWGAAGDQFLGGNLRGLRSKIGYLKRMGVTAIWVSPVFKQVAADNSYHGYGIQNFLDIDPHFGTRQELKDFVDEAHQNGIYVILDIIFNHSGNVFEYSANRYPTQNGGIDPRWDGQPYTVKGYRNAFGIANIPFGRINPATHPAAWPNDAIWPAELQDPQTFTRLGRIDNWDYDPEFLEGDFVTLRDIDHGFHERNGSRERIVDSFIPTQALRSLVEIYQFWIAFADIDGYRIDTVKHMELGATRLFAAAIKEFAQSIGKENFFLLGEITGGRQRAFETMGLTGLSAALGIDDVQDKLEFVAKGSRNPTDYFSLFRNSELVQQESHVWFGKHVVTMIDDHDQVRKGSQKARFCAQNGFPHLLPALALNLTTMGIPCLYYGTEQAFDGSGDNDRFLRECMFGGRFGSLQSTDRHFFNETHPTFVELGKIAELRRQKIALRRGRQYLREISDTGNDGDFGLPRMIGSQIRSIIPWSRLFHNTEILLAINTDSQSRSTWVTIDHSLHQAGDTLTCLYSTDPQQIGAKVTVQSRHGKAVFLTLPAHGFSIWE